MIDIILNNLINGDVGILVNSLDNADSVWVNVLKEINFDESSFGHNFIRVGQNMIFVIPINASLKGKHPKVWLIDDCIDIKGCTDYLEMLFNGILHDKCIIKFVNMEKYK